MRTVISASRRTDLPGLYMDWFLARLCEGFVDVPNPVITSQTYRVDLRPESVHTFVLWSKNYEPFLRSAIPFERYRWYFNFTIDGNEMWSRRAPHSERQLIQLEELAERFGPACINWRFDPILYWADGRENNVEPFFSLCDRIASAGVTRCTFSFAHWYGKVKRRAREFGFEPFDPPLESKRETVARLAEYAAPRGVTLYTCSNDALLGHANVRRGACVDGRLLADLAGEPCSLARDTSQRTDCGCTKSADIGSYVEMPCRHACIHCYANPVFD